MSSGDGLDLDESTGNEGVGGRPRTLSLWGSPGDDRAVIVIHRPGAYALAQDVIGVPGKAAIRIEASRVELILGGFELVGCAGSLEGIVIAHDGARVRISNGRIRGWGRDAIDARRAAVCELEQMEIKGRIGESLVAGGETVVRNCRLLGSDRRWAWGLWRAVH
jgi:hypothetical protein